MTTGDWNRSGPEWDLPKGTPARVCYVIASLPRTGSTLLARSLWTTGAAGAPDEYLNPLQRRRFGRWGLPSLPEYVRHLRQHRTSANGVFGLKIHFAHLDRQVLRAGYDLPGLLGPLRWVAVTRVDLVAQAVSLEMARRTGRWWGEQPEPDPPPGYDRAALERRLDEIRHGEIGWERYFAAHGIRPLRLTYEAITEQRERSIRSVLRHLGVTADVAAVPEPATVPTRTVATEAWIERFRGETGDPPDRRRGL